MYHTLSPSNMSPTLYTLHTACALDNLMLALNYILCSLLCMSNCPCLLAERFVDANNVAIIYSFVYLFIYYPLCQLALTQQHC